MCTTYNGWANKETWLINLWDDGDYWQETAQEIYNAFPGESDTYITNQLADQMESQYDDFNPVEESASVWTDLMNCALGNVNWYELAEHYIDEIERESD